ncbi:hypothetical protein PG996_009769 [Apiospora saccharicola]|uniref:Uncharacterized protein n=1 Tax=Apiospora saccharicola TaxID=335842 RepID=A0ABR1UPT3_9PEZI
MASRIPRIHSRAIRAVAPSVPRLSLPRTTTPVAAGHFSTTTLGAQAESGSAKSSSQSEQQQKQNPVEIQGKDGDPKPEGHKKTIAELDDEMMKKMSGIAGDGGSAGVEYEDGQPVAMKRSVKNNMFRYI